MPVIEFEGQSYDFPEDATQEEISTTLGDLPKEESKTLPEDKQEAFPEQDIIKKDEGIKRNKEGSHIAYKDSEGNPTGGIGHSFNDEERKLYPIGTPIPDDVVKQWFKTDMVEADEILTRVLEEKAVHVPDDVYNILLNMTFNLGEKGIKGFTDMWTAIELGQWKAASKEMLVNAEGDGKSLWFKQVGNRAQRLSDRMANVKSIVQEQVQESE